MNSPGDSPPPVVDATTLSAGRSKDIHGTGRSALGRPMRAASSATDGGVVAAPGVDGAVDGILSTIRYELASDDLLVVWLLDASLSLYDDRQQVAARIEPFYRDIAANHKQSHLLMNAAVAFGAATAELVAPTRFGLAMVEAVSKTPIDTTGLENVMTAVEQCVYKYRKNWKGSILIVVWTDESGDDTLRLEDIIAMCRQERIVVSVVGPSSAFGSERGVHPWRDRAPGTASCCRSRRAGHVVCRAAAAALLARFAIGALDAGRSEIAEGAAWYGGPYREGLLSGVGPYALTRLALETGGKFTLLDHAFSSGQFKFDDMKNYLPDYGPANEYLRSIKQRPLRKAIYDVVQLTYEQQEAMAIPKMMFDGSAYRYYPFPILYTYYTQDAFRRALPDAFTNETANVALSLTVIERAVSRFGSNGMEQDYQRETSPRWRAWYDLNARPIAGHERAASRIHFYLPVGDSECGALNPETNHVSFEPSSQLKSDRPEVRKRVVEAERLLKRCVEKNPNTPWAQLAQWELANPLGLQVREVVIPPPPPPQPVMVTPAAVPSLPSL